MSSKYKLLGNGEKGKLFVLSAPAGTGKTTLVRMLREEFSSISPSISFTTRSPRMGEIDGAHYHFIKREEFEERMKKRGVFRAY